MAERRMFAKTIIDSDAFLDMPLSTQALYFHLSMRADDEGFLNNAKKIMREIGANQNDYDVLVSKRFIIQFPDGICVIKHWRIHNYIQSDRFKPTMYQEEKSMLTMKKNKSYTLDTECIHDGYSLETQVRLGKDSIGKVNKDICIPSESSAPKKPPKHKHGNYNHVLLSDQELEKLNMEYGETQTAEAIKYLDEYIEMKGTKYRSHYLALRKWVFDAVKQHSGSPQVRKNKFNNFENQRSEQIDESEFIDN